MPHTSMPSRFAALACLALGVFAAPGTAAAADFYACDCDASAAPGCTAGNDANDGASPATAWRSYRAVANAFSSLQAGDSLRFCRGGAFVVDAARRWNNSNCRAAAPCVVADYTPAWATGAVGKPIIWVRTAAVHAFNLEDGGNADHEEGYTFRNLDLRSTAAAGDAWAFFLYNDIDDVLIEDVDMDGFGIGVHQAGSNACDAADPACDGKNSRLTVRRARIVNSVGMGYLGGGDDSTIEDSTFEHNGSQAVFDHNVYLSGDVRGMVFRRNQLYRSAVQATGECGAASLVVHGNHTDLTIEDNLIREDVGAAGQGCWGIEVDPGYATAESFTRVAIRGNRVLNVGNVGIGLTSCADCVIEDNVIVGEQPFGSVGIAVPDRTRGPEDQAMTGVTVRNNSLFLTAGSTGIRLGSEGSGHLVASNAIRFAGTGGGSSCFAADLPASAYTSFDYNVCAPGAGTWELGAGGLSAWQAARGFDAHSTVADPGFASPAGPAFDLRAAAGTSPMVDRGDPAHSSPLDLEGHPRDSSPDQGAYEFGSAAPDGGSGDGGGAPADAGDPGGGVRPCSCAGAGSGPAAVAGLLVLLAAAALRRWAPG